jgi:hypothetical protein
MHTTAEKTNRSSTVVQQKTPGTSFFRKAGEESFFGTKEEPSFFNKPIQTKLSVSSPDDPQEKEADEVADKVMRMSEPATAPGEREEGKLQRSEENEIQPKFEAPVISRLQCKEEQEELQAKSFNNIYRSSDNYCEAGEAADESSSSENYSLNRKTNSLYRSDVIQRSGRGPPVSSMPFEQILSSSKGGGSALPGSTKQYMETRFGADFSSVRIHTGSYAENLSANLHAQAFTHGNDIYFNSGKYSPHTEAGGTLLAHELTHTVQQGASPSHATSVKPSIAKKEIIQRSGAAVPQQLTDAIAKSKTVEGKIDANKPQGDGNRTGWEHLVEIFKTTFGEDKIISGSGGAGIEGAVAEQDIKKKREQSGVMVVDKTTVTSKNAIPKTVMGSRDAMPSWCGIFVFWALNKGGVPMPKWKLGERMIKPETARPPGTAPMPGDIAYRNAYSHFALVESANGNIVKTVNGNTAGEDNLGGQVQTLEHPMSDWTAFFNPLLIMEGSLGSGEGPVNEKPKTLAELRKEIFNVNPKEEEGEQQEDIASNNEGVIQSKTELSDLHVNAAGKLHTPTHTNIHLSENTEALEEEKTEEKESRTSAPSNSSEKITAYPLQHKCEACDSEEKNIQAKNEPVIQTQQTDSSLNGDINEVNNKTIAEQDMGPPVQLKANGKEVIQRSVIDDALAYAGSVTDCISIPPNLNESKTCVLRIAQNVAMHIPGYRALRVVLGSDPITGADVERNGRNFIEAAFDIMPGGQLLHQKLDELHLLDAAAAWIDRQIASVELLVNDLFSAFDRFWEGIGLSDITSPMDVLEEGANIVLGFIDSIIDFAVEAATELLEMVKDYLLAKIVEFIKEHTTAYPLLTVILGKDPITDEEVESNGTTILNALLELGGEEGIQQRTQMQETGTFEKAAAFIDEGIAVFSGAYDRIVQGFKNIWDEVSIESLMDPVGTFERIYNEFAEPVGEVLDFVLKVGAEILKFIKEVLMQRLSVWARTVRGYYLVTVIIGKDPFTDALVPFTMENVIHGFMSLMEGGEEQFAQMKESGAIDRTTQKITAAVARLNMTPESIVQLFIDLWNSFSINDLADPIAAFQRIIDKFGEPIGRLIAFVIEIIKIVIVTILEIMEFPFDLINNIIAKAMLAFQMIKADPIGFLKNLLRAIKQGFSQFFGNILTHLWSGLKSWFLGEVEAAGIPIPTDFSVMGILTWLLAVLDITMEKIWKKLEDRIGKEKVTKIRNLIERAEQIAGMAGEAYEFYQDVKQRGFMAVIADKIKEKLSDVWNMVLQAVQSFVMDQIIKKITVKLLSMLDPTGIMAVINSAIALYKAIQSFIRYLRQMLEIVNSFVEGVVEIASGATQKAADFLEGALARGIPIAIGFFANQVGLDLSERLKDALELVREKVDKGLDWVIDKLVTIVEKLVTMGRAAVASLVEWWKAKKEFTANDAKKHKVYFEGNEANPVLTIQSDPTPYTNFLNNYESQLGTSANDEVTVGSAKKTKATVIAEARVTAGKIETEKQKKLNTYPGADDKAKEEAKKTIIDGFLQELADISVPLFGTDKPSDAEITLPVGNNNHQFATTQEAVNIYKTPKVTSNGSGPTAAKHNIYDVIDYRQKGNASYYIRGHLINDNLGGPGMWSNMTALSRTGNHKHEELAESAVKAAFDAGAVVRYKVTASGNQGAQPPTPADKSKFTRIADIDKNFDLIQRIINAEKNVITTLKCEAYTRKKEGSAWVDDKLIVATDVPNELELNYESYELGDNIPAPIVNLKTGENQGKLPEVIDYAGNKIVLASKIIRFVQHKKQKTGVSFATYEGLASYKIVITPEPLAVAEFTSDEKAYITGKLKTNNNVILT